MSTERRWEWLDPETGLELNLEGDQNVQVIHCTFRKDNLEMAQAVSNYAMWLAAQADELKANLEEHQQACFEAGYDLAERDDEIAALKQELATAKRELGHRREGWTRPDYRKEQDRRTE